MDTHSELFPAPAVTTAKTAKPVVRPLEHGAFAVNYRGVPLVARPCMDGVKGTVAWWDVEREDGTEVVVRAWNSRSALESVVGELDRAAKFARASKRSKRAATVTHDVSQSGFEGAAVVTPGDSVRLVGREGYERTGFKPVDHTFKLGDRACYGSYNLYYFGDIVAIGAKTITIEANGRRRRLDFATFASRNHGDPERKLRNNAEWMD